MAWSAVTQKRSPSSVSWALHRLRRAVMRAFSASQHSPFLVPARGKGMGKQAAALSHPRPSACSSPPRAAMVPSREAP